MSSDSNSKPLPSAAVINAYLEVSAARTRMRLPIAKLVVPPAAEGAQGGSGAVAVQKSKVLPTTRAGAAVTPPGPATAGHGSRAGGAPPEEGAEAGWRPFGADEES